MFGVVSSIGLFWIAQDIWRLDPEQSRTLAFMAILCGGNLTIYLTRNTGMLWMKPYPEYKFFLGTLFSLIVGTLVSVYGLGSKDFVGIGWHYVGISWIYILVWFIVCMFTKYAIYKIIKHEDNYHESYLDKEVSEHLEQVGL